MCSPWPLVLNGPGSVLPFQPEDRSDVLVRVGILDCTPRFVSLISQDVPEFDLILGLPEGPFVFVVRVIVRRVQGRAPAFVALIIDGKVFELRDVAEFSFSHASAP